MAEHNEHLKMKELYIELAKQNYQKAERVEGIEYKVGYFALSAEGLLVSCDHLLAWFTRIEANHRTPYINALERHGKFRKRLSSAKVEYVRSQLLYLRTISLNDAIFIVTTILKQLLD